MVELVFLGITLYPGLYWLVLCGLQLQGDRVHASEEGIQQECEAGHAAGKLAGHISPTHRKQRTKQEVGSGYKPSKIPTLWHTSSSKVPPLRVSVCPQAEPLAQDQVIKHEAVVKISH